MQISFTTGSYKRSMVRSIVSILLGIVLVAWPTEVLNYTVKIIGAVFCVVGVVSFLVSLKDREQAHSGLFSFNGIGSIILGLLLWFMADTLTNILMYLLGFILLFAGVAQLVLLTTARRFGRVPFVNFLFPILILIAGFVIFANPFSAKESIIVFFGAFIIFYGVTDLFNQYNINKLRNQMNDESQLQRTGGSEIVDTDFEEVDD